MGSGGYRRAGGGYTMEHLVKCVTLSGVLRGAADLRDAMTMAISAALPPAFAQPFLRGLADESAVPSRASVLRHRLTLHLGWLRWSQALLSDLLSSSEDLVSWQTADSSPQGSFDWMMRAGATARQSAVTALFFDAVALQQDPAFAWSEDAVELVRRLRDALAFTAGPPCGIGSGRASAWHKMHALLHGLRLECPSWGAAAK
eukprot:3249314-Alexandrium_andersonii.AAC.1